MRKMSKRDFCLWCITWLYRFHIMLVCHGLPRYTEGPLSSVLLCVVMSSNCTVCRAVHKYAECRTEHILQSHY